MFEGWTLTVLFSMGDQELQHLVHCPHIKDDSQLGHPHGNQTPEEDGRKHRPTERNRICERTSVFIFL